MGNYIGGTPKEARIKYYNLNPDLLSTIVEISLRYKIDPALLAYRLSKEGIVDSKIQDYNKGVESEKINSTNLDRANEAFLGFGTDWLADRVKSGNVKLNRVIPFTTREFVNEKREVIHPPLFFTNYDNMEGVAAQLKKIQEEVNEDFANQNIDRSAAIMAYYNRGRGGGRSYIRNSGNSYLDYKVPVEFQELLKGVSPSQTPVIDYGNSKAFKYNYNYIKNKKYEIPEALRSPKNSYSFIPMIIPQEQEYINNKRNKEFLDYLGITESLADSIMNAAIKNKLNKFKLGGKLNYLNYVD